MKKVLSIILLIALCCASVFAVDLSTILVFNVSYGENGLSYVSNAGIWEPVLIFGVDGDKAGAAIQFAFPDYDSIALRLGTYVTPRDSYRISLGADVNVSFKEGVTGNDLFGSLEFNTSEKIENDTFSSQYRLGFKYKPNLKNTTAKESTVFLAGEANQHIVGSNYIHLDAISKLSLANGKAELVSVIGDAYWNYQDSENEDGTKRANFSPVYFIKAISDSDVHKNGAFGWNEETYNNRRDYSYAAAYVSQTTTNAITAGLRYKYNTQEDKTQYNGLYGYAWGNYVSDGIIYQAEAEVGKTICLELGSRSVKNEYAKEYIIDADKHIKRQFNEIVYARADFDFTGDEVEAKLTEVYSKLTYAIFGPNAYNDDYEWLYTPQLLINYNNKASNTPETNGLFLTPGVTTSIGACGIDYGFKLGIDSLKKFHWSSDLKTSIKF